MVLSVDGGKIHRLNMSLLETHTILAQLPLFQGMSLTELDDAIGQCSLHFTNYRTGRLIAAEDDMADRLLFVVEGEVLAETKSDDKAYSLVERFRAPFVIQPERLFGLTQRYSCAITAHGACRVMSITKSDVIRLTTTSEVFRINILNTLCTTTQRKQRLPWHNMRKGVRSKLLAFLQWRCSSPAGYKELHITMVRLGQEIGESRLNVSRELAVMQSENLLEMRRNCFVIPHMERLKDL